MSTILVAGAAGFIAYKVCQDLLKDGHTVYGIDNVNDAYDVNLKKWHLAQIMPFKRFTFSKFDICNKKALSEVVVPGKIDAVINLAARAGIRASLDNPWEFISTNVTGTLNLLEFCRERKTPKFILASSSSVYGSHPPLPTPESADASHPMQPYAASKIAAEALCHSYHHLYDLDVTIFRYFNVFGPGLRSDLAVFRFFQRIMEDKTIHIYGDGTLTRGFTYLDDISRGTILGLQPLGFEVINLGGHEQVSINDLVSRIEVVAGKKAAKHHTEGLRADMQANWADTSKARTMLNWDPQVDLDEGLRHLKSWYVKESSWLRMIDTD